MAYFDRLDICEAYLAVEWDWHAGGILYARPSNRRRNMSTDFQLRRMKFKAGATWNGRESLSANGQEIYDLLCERWNLEE
jgi:hypothetical protein